MIDRMGDVLLVDSVEDTSWSGLKQWSRSLNGYLINHPELAQILRHLYFDPDTQPQSRMVPMVMRSCKAWTKDLIGRGQSLGNIGNDLPNELLFETLDAMGIGE